MRPSPRAERRARCGRAVPLFVCRSSLPLKPCVNKGVDNVCLIPIHIVDERASIECFCIEDQRQQQRQQTAKMVRLVRVAATQMSISRDPAANLVRCVDLDLQVSAGAVVSVPLAGVMAL